MTTTPPPAMPHRQNRVDPWGALQAVPQRGTRMGNRGILHLGQHVVRPWAHKAWVHCVLDASFQKRKPFSPNTYSELFFLDEATALAAGHRPCRTCQRERHVQFNTLWTQANLGTAAGGAGRRSAPVATIDEALHAERIGPGKTKRTTDAVLASLPPGAMVAHAGRAWLVAGDGVGNGPGSGAGQGACLPWSFSGYGPAERLPPSTPVQVLTPASIVHTLRAGYQPQLHPSATQPD